MIIFEKEEIKNNSFKEKILSAAKLNRNNLYVISDINSTYNCLFDQKSIGTSSPVLSNRGCLHTVAGVSTKSSQDVHFPEVQPILSISHGYRK